MKVSARYDAMGSATGGSARLEIDCMGGWKDQRDLSIFQVAHKENLKMMDKRVWIKQSCIGL